jgi:hypothetical protein
MAVNSRGPELTEVLYSVGAIAEAHAGRRPYYRSRAQEEIDAAMAAELTSADLELAQRYEDLANAGRSV